MIIKSPYIIKQMIEHRHLFTDLVAYVEDNDGDVEIPVSLYRGLVKKAIQSLDDQAGDQDRRRLQLTLREENLLYERLIIRIDPSRGRLVLAPFLLDMLRHFDVQRMRGLSEVELEELRRGLNESLQRFHHHSFDPEDDDFREALRLLRRQIQDTLGKMQESVAALELQCDHLSEVVETQSIESIEGAERSRQALEHINSIYQRHILPALDFLDPKAQFKQGFPAVIALRRLSELANDHDRTIGNELGLSAGAIQSYVKDIDALRLSLERYVRQNQRQRHQYDRVEQAFNALKQAAEDRHDDNLRNKYIPVQHPAIQSPGTFRGIKRRIFRRIDWHDGDHKADIEEFTDRRIKELRAERDQEGSVAIDASRTGLSTAELTEQLREQHIHGLLKEWAIPDGCQDLHAALHDYLVQHMEGYTLNDLLDALDWVMALPNLRYKARIQHHVLTHHDLELSYHPLTPITVTEDAAHA